MKQYEIRTKDLKTVIHLDEAPESNREAIDSFNYYCRIGSSAWLNGVLVLHEFETSAEADRARLDWIDANPGRFVSELSLGISNAKSARSVIDTARQAPQPIIRVIATPEGNV